MLAADPEERLTMENVLEHPWIQGKTSKIEIWYYLNFIYLRQAQPLFYLLSLTFFLILSINSITFCNIKVKNNAFFLPNRIWA